MVVVPGNLPLAPALSFVVLSPLLHSRKRHLFGLVCHVAQEVWQTVSTISRFSHFWALSQISDTQWQWQLPTGTTLLLHNHYAFLVISTTSQTLHIFGNEHYNTNTTQLLHIFGNQHYNTNSAQLLRIFGNQHYNTNTTQHLVIDTTHFW